MADVFDFYVRDNRKIIFEIAEPIMREDSGVTDFRFHIPKTLNGLEVSDWSWWFVFVNAKKEKYSVALTLSDDPESPLEFNIATYTVDYAMSIKAGAVQFALEAINAGTGGAIDNEWHTLTYETKVKETLQGNQAEYAETESDVISALLIEVRNKVTQLVGGATPLPVNLKSLMTDPQKVYLYTGSEQGEYTGNWYYHNGTQFVSGGVYGAGVTDAVPTQGSSNAVQSGGVYSALAEKADASELSAITTATSDDVGKALKAKTVTNGKVTEWEFGEAGGADPSAIEQAVTDWLDDHPEATTTVPDYSLESKKLVKGTLGYVTPEMYGAVGDGITDDSTAVQSAVNASNNVHFTKGKTYYLASQVVITNDTVIEGHGATIKTATPSGGRVNRAFYIHGTLKTTTTLTTDYTSTGDTANSSNRLTLADMSACEIGDIVVVKATDQYYSYSRQYYYLGATLAITDIYDGHIYVNTSMPWDITLTNNVSAVVYKAPRVSINNMNFVSDLDSFGTYNALIHFYYCYAPTVTNCTLSTFVMGVYFSYCVNAYADNLRMSKSKYENTISGDGYGICVESSTNTTIQRVIALCAQGCIDLSGDVPCIDTFISKCDVTSEARAIGIDLHDNNYNVVIEDCTLGGISALGTVTVNRCRFYKNARFTGSSTIAITYRGSYKPEWATLDVTNCIFEGAFINLTMPGYQNGIQAMDHYIGRVSIKNCTGGALMCEMSTNSNILSNTINEMILDDWKNCLEVYHPAGALIKKMIVNNCEFTHAYWINNHRNADGIVLTDLDELTVYNTIPLVHKRSINKTTHGDQYVLPEGVPITLSSSNQSAQFVICGNNIRSDNLSDYRVGLVTGSSGGTINRTIATGDNAPTLSLDNDGNIVYTQSNNGNSFAFYPVGMFYAQENSLVAISADLVNTGPTNGVTWKPFIAVVNCDTGKLVDRYNIGSGTSSAEGTAVSFSTSVPANHMFMCYMYCSSAISGAVTTFRNFAVTCTPVFAPQIIDDTYKAKRLTGNGTLTSFSGVNNILCSELTFDVEFTVDYVNNPLGGITLVSGEGVSF